MFVSAYSRVIQIYNHYIPVTWCNYHSREKNIIRCCR